MPSLAPVPSTQALAATRRSWHLLAAHVVAEERFRRVGHSGLEPTPQGFRTPGEELSGVEVELDQLVIRRADGVLRRSVTTIGDAQSWVLGEVGPPRWGQQPGLHDPPPPVPADTLLPIDPAVAGWLGRWFHLGYAALGELIADEASADAGVPTLWPEHFDVGIEVLPDDRRASYGVSPGDTTIAEPYAYVALWEPDRHGAHSDPWWSATALTGATMTARGLAETDEPGRELLAWFRAGRDRLLAT